MEFPAAQFPPKISQKLFHYGPKKFSNNKCSQMAKIAIKLSAMVGDIFENQHSQMAIIALKLSTMVGEIFKYQHFQMAIIALKLSTMGG